MALAMAPTNLWITLFIGFSALYVMLDRTKTPRSAFGVAFIFSYAYFMFSLSWIGNALLVDGNMYAWAYPLALFGVPLGVNLWFALACYGVKRFFDLRHISGFMAFIALVTFSEWVRGGVILNGFPWNSFGYGWASVLEIAQIVYLDNIFLLTLLTIVWAITPAFLFMSRGKSRIIGGLITIVSLTACYIYGAQRLAASEKTYRDDIQLRIIQPNIAQADKWNPAKFDENLGELVRLSQADNEVAPTTYIIWPETSLTYRHTSDPLSRHLIEQTLQSYEGKAYIFTGFLRYYPESGETYNSLAMIGDIEDGLFNVYDKHHLVPFGEYIPFQKWIPLDPITNFSGFVRGSGPDIMRTPENVSYMPLICYESIFTNELLPTTQKNQPDFLLNVVNDAWYGDSAGPYQHLTQGIFRSIETGSPLVRATSTGVSGLFSPLGREIAKTKLFQPTKIVQNLPHKIDATQHHNPFKGHNFFILLFILLGLATQLKCKKII